MMNKKKKGFTLVELMLVIGVMIIMSIMKVKSINEENEDLQSKILAEQVNTVSQAANALLVLKYSELSNLSSPDIPCTPSTQTCDLTIDQLINNSLLPPNFSRKTIFGQPYEIQIKRTGSSPNYMLSGLVLTKGGRLNEVNPSSVLMGKVARNIGGDGGVNNKTGEVIGTSGGWSANTAVYPILAGKKGYVGASVGALSGAYYVYLRRDGTLPMTGNLNLGGKNIYNVKAIIASGDISTPTNISAANFFASSGITSSGYIGATGNINSSANIYGAGTITAGGGLISNSTIIGKGQLYVQNNAGDLLTLGGDANGNDYELKLSNSAKHLTVWNTSSGEIPDNSNKNKLVMQVAGAFKSGNIESVGKVTIADTLNVSNRVTLGEYLSFSGEITAGSACDTVGLQGKTKDGYLLSCIGGIWQPEQPVGTPIPWPSETPPAGWLVANGQTFDVAKYPLLARAYPSGKLPDLRGVFIRGLDQGRGIDRNRVILTDQRSSVVTGTDDNWAASDIGALHGPSSAYSRDDINIADYTNGSNGQQPKYYIGFSSSITGPQFGNVEMATSGVALVNNGSNSFYGGARPYNTSFVYIVRAM